MSDLVVRLKSSQRLQEQSKAQLDRLTPLDDDQLESDQISKRRKRKSTVNVKYVDSDGEPKQLDEFGSKKHKKETIEENNHREDDEYLCDEKSEDDEDEEELEELDEFEDQEEENDDDDEDSVDNSIKQRPKRISKKSLKKSKRRKSPTRNKTEIKASSNSKSVQNISLVVRIFSVIMMARLKSSSKVLTYLKKKNLDPVLPSITEIDSLYKKFCHTGSVTEPNECLKLTNQAKKMTNCLLDREDIEINKSNDKLKSKRHLSKVVEAKAIELRKALDENPKYSFRQLARKLKLSTTSIRNLALRFPDKLKELRARMESIKPKPKSRPSYAYFRPGEPSYEEKVERIKRILDENPNYSATQLESIIGINRKNKFFVKLRKEYLREKGLEIKKVSDKKSSSATNTSQVTSSIDWPTPVEFIPTNTSTTTTSSNNSFHSPINPYPSSTQSLQPSPKSHLIQQQSIYYPDTHFASYSTYSTNSTTSNLHRPAAPGTYYSPTVSSSSFGQFNPTSVGDHCH